MHRARRGIAETPHVYGRALLKSAAAQTPAMACALNPETQLKQASHDGAAIGRASATVRRGAGAGDDRGGDGDDGVRPALSPSTPMSHAPDGLAERLALPSPRRPPSPRIRPNRSIRFPRSPRWCGCARPSGDRIAPPAPPAPPALADASDDPPDPEESRPHPPADERMSAAREARQEARPSAARGARGKRFPPSAKPSPPNARPCPHA